MKIKLSSEFVQVLGDLMPEFTTLCRLGYLAVRKHWRQVPLRPPGPFPPGSPPPPPPTRGCLAADPAFPVLLNRSEARPAPEGG